MPNLQYDPNDPSDLIGQPIREGDIVAWGTTFGKSPAIAVAEIIKIRFVRKHNGKNIEVPQGGAEEYQLMLREIKSTGNSQPQEFIYDPDNGGFFQRIPYSRRKTKQVRIVKNIVKLDMTRQEAMKMVGETDD